MRNQAQKVSVDRCRTERRLDYPLGSPHHVTRRVDSSVSSRVPHPSVSKASGFTMVELMVTLAIGAVLATFALPAFNGFIGQQRLTSAANGFAGAIAYARSESTRRGATVSLQAQSADSGDEWGGGYCVVVGNPGNCFQSLRVYDPLTRASMNGQGALNDVETLSFNSRGLFTLGASGALDLCSDDTLDDPGRRLQISVIGRLNISEFECPD